MPIICLKSRAFSLFIEERRYLQIGIKIQMLNSPKNLTSGRGKKSNFWEGEKSSVSKAESVSR